MAVDIRLFFKSYKHFPEFSEIHSNKKKKKEEERTSGNKPTMRLKDPSSPNISRIRFFNDRSNSENQTRRINRRRKIAKAERYKRILSKTKENVEQRKTREKREIERIAHTNHMPLRTGRLTTKPF